MKKKEKLTRIAAVLLAVVLIFNNDQMIYALAEEAGIRTNAADQLSQNTGIAPSGELTASPQTQDEAGSSMNVDSSGSGSSDDDNKGDGGSNRNDNNDSSTGGNSNGNDNMGSGNGNDNDGDGSSSTGGSSESDNNAGSNHGDDNSSGSDNNNNGDNNSKECEHEWVTDPDTLFSVCSKCGAEKSDNVNNDNDDSHNDNDDNHNENDDNGGSSSGESAGCEHEWITDPDTLFSVCSKCGTEKTDDDNNDDDDETGSSSGNSGECGHEWIRDPETLKVICGLCGEDKEDYVEQDECPEGGFHVYDLMEDGTGYVCVICGAWKESLDALDVTLEMYLYAMNGQAGLFAADDPDDRASSTLPKTVAELEAMANKELTVASLGDLLVVQDLSGLTDFEDYTIVIMNRKTVSGGTGTTTWDLRGSDFQGLGNEEHPFQGKIRCLYTGGSTLFQLDQPFFQYLSTDADISEMALEGAINQNTTDPVGLLAATLVKGEQEKLTLKNVITYGSVSNGGGAAGIVFGRVENQAEEPILLSFDNSELAACLTVTIGGADHYYNGSVSGIHAGGIAGEAVGNVVLEIKDPAMLEHLEVSSVSVWNNGGDAVNEGGKLGWNSTSAGGMYVGAMDGGKVTIAGNSTPYKVNVQRAEGTGGANGGFLGMALGTDIATDASAAALVAVDGTGVAGRIAGGILGYYDHYNHSGVEGKLCLDYITVNTTIDAAQPGNYFAGGVLGRYYRNEAGDVNNAYDRIDHVIVNKEVSAAYFAGGVVGFVHGSNLQIGGDDSQSISVMGSVTNHSGWGSEGDACGAGGVAGLISGQYVEIRNVVVGNAGTRPGFASAAFATGGIVGAVGKIKGGFLENQKSIVKIYGAEVAADFEIDGSNSSKCRGGLLGMVFPGNMIAIDGEISIDMTTSVPLNRMGLTGHIAGYQKEALLYFEEGVSYTRPEGKSWVDDIGNYGGVYRNGTWGEGAQLISYDQGKVMGTVGSNGSSWLIDSEADLIRLAIMLNSQGNFAADCFPGCAFGNAGKQMLLAADYLVTKSLDLTQGGTVQSGIYSLNRNDSTGLNELFTGRFAGDGSGTVTIRLEDPQGKLDAQGNLEDEKNLVRIHTRQSNLALFPTAGNGAEISGFRLERFIDGANSYAAGIVCRALGNFKAEDLDIHVGIRSFYSNGHASLDADGKSVWDSYHYYGGLAAYVDTQGSTTFQVENVKIGGIFIAAEPRDLLHMGGMTADYVQNGAAPSTIQVKNFELMDDFYLKVYRTYGAGMITLINPNASGDTDQTKLSMENITIHNGARIYHERDHYAETGGWLGLTWKNIVPDDGAHYSIKGLTIGDGGAAGAGPFFSTRSLFGGLVDTVTGRIQLKDINIKNGIFENRSTRTSSITERTGLLFRVGTDALIEIDGYTIDGRGIGDSSGANNSGNVQIRGCDDKWFDEIVAYSIGTYTNAEHHTNNEYRTGGIVNLIYPGFSNDGSAEHHTYQNRLLAPKNDRTRYYYNLFGNSFEAEGSYLADGEKLTAAGTTIINERQMMIWHLSQYMNNSIRRFLALYYAGGSISARNTDTTLRGAIDLDKVSYYPTPVAGGIYTFADQSVVTFYGKDITDKATETMTPSSDQKQHYMMHSGLLISKEGEVTVRGADADNFLTLTGSVTNLGSNSGALFSREITGTKKIYRIRLENLSVADYKAEDPAGLLIGIVDEAAGSDNGVSVRYPSTLDLSWIETIGYEGFTGKAASALIGRVGTPEARKISIEFSNIRVDSRKDGIFQYASLIDENYYVEDTTDQGTGAGEGSLRRIRYLFTEAAFSGVNGAPYFPFDGAEPVYGNNQYNSVGSYVTIGSELAEGIEYWDKKEGPEESHSYVLPFTGSFLWTESEITAVCLPYVHTEGHAGGKEVEVNPKNVSITQGCGTYEDPYIIDDPKQLLALARYLQNKNDYKYLGGWQINVYESGRNGSGGICNKTHLPVEDPDTDLRTYPSQAGVALPGDFPTQEQLSQAYYMIREDIDLSKMSNATDRQTAEDFVGLGTESMPFRGVIIGVKSDYDQNGAERFPKITLPLRKNWTLDTYKVNHGLIQFAKGVVVKDLIIAGAEDTPERTGVVRVQNMAGGAIACVLGGDNIIDNVSVKLQVALTAKTSQAGAYVGDVRQGSLILRNLNENAAEQFQIGQWNGGTTLAEKFRALEARELENYPYVSGLIGKVEDGCVIYEDTFEGKEAYTELVLAHELTDIPGIYHNDVLPICRHYDLLVKSGLDQENPGKIRVEKDAAGAVTQFTAQVDTAAQLQIVSMAINSDAFSIYYEKGGYDKQAVCRKAEYSDVGEVNASNQGAGSDFQAAAKEDDGIYYYPYLYNFFDFTGAGGRAGTLQSFTVAGSVSPGYVSLLNAAAKEVNAVMNYRLKNDPGKNVDEADYDMSVYCRGFRGLGATYGMLENTLQYGNRVSSDHVIAEDKPGGFYSDFRANFDGAGATIHIDIDRTYDSSIHTAALFNDLLDRTAAKDKLFTIKNFTVTGSVTSVTHTRAANGNDTTDGNKAYPNRTSAVIGFMRRPWELNNVAVRDMQIEGQGHVGGIVAWIDPENGAAYEFKKCRVEENARIYSYGGSVGGIIGVLTQNDTAAAFQNVSLKLSGCEIAGTADRRVEIAVKNRTADNYNLGAGETSGSQGYNNQLAAGRSGGLAGYIGKRYWEYGDPSVQVTIASAPDGTVSSAVYAAITGAYSTGGFLGEYDAAQANPLSKVMIKQGRINNCEIEGTRGNVSSNRDDYYNFGVGGLIGEMRGNAFEAGEAGKNDSLVISDTNILSSAATGNGMYVGGVIGCLKTRNASFTGILVKGTIDQALRNSLELGGQQSAIQSGRAEAGGVIGKAAGEGAVTPRLAMSGIQISGMNITVSDWAEEGGKKIFKTKDSDVVSGGAGGVIGTNEMELTIRGTGAQPGSGAKVENCMITASGGNAGGIAGCLYKHNADNVYLRSTDIQDVVVKENIIGYNNLYRLINNETTAGAGGIYGKITSTKSGDEVDKVDASNSLHRLENAVIEGCWIYGPSAGGVLGYAQGTAICSNQKGNETAVSVEVRSNSLYGIHVGGAAGSWKNSAVNYIGMRIENNRLQAYQSAADKTAAAGGFAGYTDQDKEDHPDNPVYTGRLDYIKIEGNHILAANASANKRISAGGFFGHAGAAHIYVYQPELICNQTGYSDSANGGTLVTGKGVPGLNIAAASGTPGQMTLQSLFNSGSGEISKGARVVELIKGTSADDLTHAAMPSAAQLKTEGIGAYAGRIGNFAGTCGTSYTTTYFLSPVLSFQNQAAGDLVTTRPVIDVGMEQGIVQSAAAGPASGAAGLDTLLDLPYAYRNQVHIIYHDVAKDADAQVWDQVAGIEGQTADQWSCLFDGISYRGIIEAFKEAENTADLSKYLDAYRLNILSDEHEGARSVEEVYEKLYRNDDGLLTPLKTGADGAYLPAVVLDTQYGTADQLVKGVVAALTGAGGVYNSGHEVLGADYSLAMEAVTEIKTTPMQINPDGSIRIVRKTDGVTEEDPSLTATDNNKTGWTVDYRTYDNDGEDGGLQTFTLLTVTYSWSYTPFGAGSRITREEVVKIPIFVVMRLGIDTHLKIVEDLAYNADKAHKGLDGSVTMANDSSYTLYAEYIYDSARKKYSEEQIDKQVTISNIVFDTVGLPQGTKLTLIDVSDKNKVYYYTVGADDPGPYSFTRFTDDEGNSYVNKKIGGGEADGLEVYGPDEVYETTDIGSDGKRETITYSDVAVERFLINVDISGVKPEDRIQSQTREFAISPALSEDLAKRTTLNTYTNIQAQIQEGIKIAFYQKGEAGAEEKTWIDGYIKAEEDGIVNIQATINIDADQQYWIAVEQNGENVIDSANSHKYLELQIYLTGPDGQELPLPDGTNVFIEGERTKPELPQRPGSIPETALGAYHDTSNIYFYKDGNLKFELDGLLGLIKEAGLTSSDGIIRWADGLRLDFRNADMTPYDAEQYTVNLRLLRIEDSDYPAAGEELDHWNQGIPAARKSDLACAVETKDLMQLGINTYENQTKMPHMVDFDFKMDFSGVFSGNDATDQAITDKQYVVAYRLWEKVSEGSMVKYVPYKGDQIDLELADDPAGKSLVKETSLKAATAGEPFWYVNYSFPWNEIKNGTQGQEEGVIVRSLKLTVKDASQMELSNYKVQAIVYVIDKDVEPDYAGLDLDTIASLTDFFIFTVGKLKTDLDY